VNDEDLERGDETPCRPWWLRDDGMARMREFEAEIDELWSEYERSLQSH
jgi:hypothetical protein